MKVLFFTPTTQRRQDDSWLQPVRDAHSQVKGVDHRIVDTRTPLSASYRHSMEWALRNDYEWVLCVEDDEEPAPDIAIQFLEVTDKFPRDGLFIGSKRLREAPIYSPSRWIYKDDPNSPGGPPIGAKPIRVVGVMPNESPPFRLFGGTLCTPMLYSPRWMKDNGLEFHGHFWNGPQDSQNWDSALGYDVSQKYIGFVACPTIHVKHWNQKTREVIP
jgi:hypothetical protein